VQYTKTAPSPDALLQPDMPFDCPNIHNVLKDVHQKPGWKKLAVVDLPDLPIWFEYHRMGGTVPPR
jgi:hypothetical protein